MASQTTRALQRDPLDGRMYDQVGGQQQGVCRRQQLYEVWRKIRELSHSTSSPHLVSVDRLSTFNPLIYLSIDDEDAGLRLRCDCAGKWPARHLSRLCL